MDKITKPVARKFFELPVQTVIEANGNVIAKVDCRLYGRRVSRG